MKKISITNIGGVKEDMKVPEIPENHSGLHKLMTEAISRLAVVAGMGGWKLPEGRIDMRIHEFLEDDSFWNAIEKVWRSSLHDKD